MDDFQPATTAEHLLWLLAEHGVEHLFLNPGTDSAPLQEAMATLAKAGVATPKVVICSFESLALAAAHGYWQVTGRPQCVFVHVDVGTQNLGAMMHNMLRDRAGVIIIAGKTPYAEEPGAPGGRSHTIHWQQDVPDQAGVVRGYAKWVMEITRPGMLARAIGRAVQVATGGLPGPAYLMVSRDVLMDPPAPELGRTTRYAVPRPPAADPETVAWIAAKVAAAERPLLITAKVGRRAAGFHAVTRLADLAGVRVIDLAESGCVSISTSHPMNLLPAADAQRAVEEADLIIAVDADAPWIPRFTRPREDATIVHIDLDPLKTSMPMWTFPVDVAVTADGPTALGQIADRLEEMGHTAQERAAEASRAPAAAGDGPITGAEVISALNGLLRPDDLVIEEAVTNARALHDHLERTEPATMFGAGAPGLGWGLAGAVGVSMASPGRRVVSVVGDGGFMFSVPTAALCLAAEAGAPIMAVVLNNDGYRASRLPVFELFPDGLSATRGDAEGTRFSAPPDFAAVARACHAHGETVTDRSELPAALQRGLQAVESGRSAVVDVHILRD
ncbi:acetolactate synthase I/II/III large subunit [Sphaerisporangium melleum]|uniref:Acetolactate synthase I/II/III large subunit n=1 Tax=Sphaerisporangium melleum TaxID=321316 RepID=A0A917VJW7_9ACTN|nr:thiamine pyrophosphate-requiring protein [Sphaerisporangium melleum]GGK88667.1 acetolactate synthase I/II/III large subunit [Sphaerisporangium melleum]GII67708.1 acetolactate synthase I/II/III large subunit [Sphaerisporangium melleum]